MSTTTTTVNVKVVVAFLVSMPFAPLAAGRSGNNLLLSSLPEAKKTSSVAAWLKAVTRLVSPESRG